ncbi:SDR family NAD(P)-dependent oxidoreductase [Castellaniella sp. S9]|uniref:SDR family NAD(P)-dependent oxidoreductase n=1 Tax=Castellaniella sp. S9 TaxID=2993652 RepID=UPI0022B4FF81|nr:SDR family NAD(P)-dependent oxidoreductase [Castellaniella sp. S9]
MGSIALVTGASAGFGAAISRRLVGLGYTVIGAARRTDRLQALRDELGASFHPLALDVGDADSVDHAFEWIQAGFPHLDLLVNNAGLALGVAPAHETRMEDWERMIATNVLGLARVTRKALPGMVERDSGHIINIGSVAGNYAYPGGNVYGATKAFVRQLSLNLRADLWDTRVRVTNIEPGLCGGTEFSVVRLEGDAERAAAVYEGVESISAEDIADTVAWIAQRPAHVNINTIELMPVAQSFAGMRIHRQQ